MAKFKTVEEKNFAIAKKVMPAGKVTCNAVRRSRDAYCQLPGVAEFARCKIHGGGATSGALDIFKQAVPFEQAQKLEILINDTLSMDNELATGKSLLVQEIETFHRMSHYLNKFMETIPVKPFTDSEDFEKEIQVYNAAINFHSEMIEIAEKRKSKSLRDAMSLIKILSDGISKNSKIKEGNKFQLDVKQISKLLKVQLEAHQVCQGCPRLKSVVEYIKEHTKDIPLNPTMGKKTKEAIGRRAYNDMVTEVDKIAEEMQPVDIDAEIVE